MCHKHQRQISDENKVKRFPSLFFVSLCWCDILIEALCISLLHFWDWIPKVSKANECLTKFQCFMKLTVIKDFETTVSPVPNGTKFRCTTNHSPALVAISNQRAGLRFGWADCSYRLSLNWFPWFRSCCCNSKSYSVVNKI